MRELWNKIWKLNGGFPIAAAFLLSLGLQGNGAGSFNIALPDNEAWRRRQS